MKSLLICFGLLTGLNLISGQHLVVKWSAGKPINVTDVCAQLPSWTLMPDSKDCAKFYLCVNHDTEEFNCAANYYFDKRELRCKLGKCPYDDSFSEVKCQSHEVQRIVNNCNAFNACFNGQQKLNTCPNGQYFNANYGSCQKIVNNAQHKCSCILPEYALVPNADNCETYYVCTEGKAVLQQCPRGQYYNERVSSCLPDLEGVCLMLPTMSPVEKEVLEVCRHGGIQGEIFQPHKDDCGKFFLCLNGRVFTMQCPKGFYYDGVSHLCNLDVDQKCIGKQKQKHMEKEKEVFQIVAEEVKKHPIKPEVISLEPPKLPALAPSHQSNHNKKKNKKQILKNKLEEQKHKDAAKEPSKVVDIKFTVEAGIHGKENKNEGDIPKLDNQKVDETKAEQESEKKPSHKEENLMLEIVKNIKNNQESSKKQKHEENKKGASNVDVKLTLESDVHHKDNVLKKELHAEKEIAIKTKKPENKQEESSELDKKHKKKNTNEKESSKVESEKHEVNKNPEKESAKAELKLTVEADIHSKDMEKNKNMHAEKAIEIKREGETQNEEIVEEIPTAESLQKLPQEKPTKSLYDKLSSKFMNF